MRTALDARVKALEAASGVSAGNRGGVLVLLPGEDVDTRLARAGLGNWLVVPGVMDAAAWQAMMQARRRGK